MLAEAIIWCSLSYITCDMPQVKTREVILTAYNSEVGVEEEIKQLAPPNLVKKALAISKCESQHGKYLTNWEGSSAKGVFMFTDKTWKNYCVGDVMNQTDNIRCFLKLYPKHPTWWKCH